MPKGLTVTDITVSLFQFFLTMITLSYLVFMAFVVPVPAQNDSNMLTGLPVR